MKKFGMYDKKIIDNIGIVNVLGRSSFLSLFSDRILASGLSPDLGT